MAPPWKKAGETYAEGLTLSSVSALGSGKRGIESTQRALAPQQPERRIDRRGDGGPGDRNTERLCNLAKPNLKLGREGVEGIVNRGCRPLLESRKPCAHLREQLERVRRQVLGDRLGIHRHIVGEEEPAVLRHLLQRLGALALREDHAFQQPLIVAVGTN